MSDIIMSIKKISCFDENATPSFCYDDCIATYAAFVGKSYQLMYLDMLKNRFNMKVSGESSIASSIEFLTKMDENLKKYSGITKTYNDEPFAQAVESIKKLLKEGQPILVGVIGYDCPWDWRYQTITEGEHVLFLTGWEEKKQSFICFDPGYGIEKEYYNIKELEKAYRYYIVFQCEKVERYDILTDLCKNMNELKQDGWLDSMKKLPEEILSKFDLSLEIVDYDENEDFSIDLMQDNVISNIVIKELVRNRNRFLNLLNYLGEEYEDYVELKTIADDFVYVAKKWEMIRMNLLRSLRVKKIDNLAQILSNKIKEVLDEEEEAIDKVIALLENKDKPSKTRVPRKGIEDIKRVEFVDIQQYLNNEGIGEEGDTQADLNEEGEHILMHSLPIDNTIIFNHMQFKLVHKKKDCPDNIACMRQTIELGNLWCISVMLLGCSDHDSISETIILQFADGTYEKRKMTFPEWIPDWNAKLYDNIAITAEKTVVNGNGEVVDTDECYLYAIEIDSILKSLSSIVLPECSNLHIFAISLGVS